MMDAAKPERSEFDSVDPTPASAIEDVLRMRSIICDENEKMFQRMRALFALHIPTEGLGRGKPNRILSHSTDF